MSRRSLLAADEPAAFTLERASGSSPYLLTCDHASALLPRALGDLGVSAHELTRHIACDIGIAAVASRVSERIDACLVRQNYSRLVIDANRPPGSPTSIVTVSERTRVPGNENLSKQETSAREHEIFHPYHDCIREQIDRRLAADHPTAVCSLHSFTPSYMGHDRPWQIGVLYNREARLARAMLELLQRDQSLVVGDNEPYFVSEQSDYTVIVHGERRGLPCIEIEIRQDLIAHPDGQAHWGDRLSELLPEVYQLALAPDRLGART